MYSFSRDDDGSKPRTEPDRRTWRRDKDARDVEADSEGHAGSLGVIGGSTTRGYLAG